ncbi:MAG: OsmC family protein [Candidatus Stahlbacteria bacterium]|nr:OsmC family protein [Candidatus Stahlbacteria bacterium]
MAKVKWMLKNMQFSGQSDSGYTCLMDTRDANTAPTPMELLLIALGGCTGMDVVSLLQKMKVKFNSLEIELKGDRSDEHPRVYKKIELVYKVKGDNVPEDKVRKAVKLSQDKYCSVSAMLKPNVEISYTIEVI